MADWLYWYEPGFLAGCAYPAADGDLAELARAGIEVVVNLHERPHDRTLLDRHHLWEVHLPVPDFTAPAPEQLDHGIAAISLTHQTCQVVDFRLALLYRGWYREVTHERGNVWIRGGCPRTDLDPRRQSAGDVRRTRDILTPGSRLEC